MISMKLDVRGLDDVKKRLARIPDALQSGVMSQAINKTAQKARAEINRAIYQEYAVKQDEVRNAIDLRTANRSDLTATISVFGSKSRRGRSANMIRFLAIAQMAGMAVKTRGAKVTRKQMKSVANQLGFQILRAGGIKKISGAFVGNKGRTVFIRQDKSRLPIEPVQVIGFGQMFNSKKINRRVMDKLRADFGDEIDRAIKKALGGY